ncbi:MAG: hypothetical protein JRH01_22285 [Deltaproteobacteria bacterium]|nr:hypothetical protein [Deltaproteobacteria bacterium]
MRRTMAVLCGPRRHDDEACRERDMAMEDDFPWLDPVVTAVVMEAARGQKAEGESEQKGRGLAHH